MYKGFIFDMNGTIIDDMDYHSQAWANIIIDELKAGISPEQLKLEMYGKNEEVLERVFGKGKFTQHQMGKIALSKEAAYQQAYRPHMQLLTGLTTFLDQAQKKGIPMSIGTAAIPYNIDFVLDNLQLRHYFKIIISANDVTLSKPHPETFLKCAAGMQVAPSDCIVFEDAPKGVEAALNAGMKAIAITTMHQATDFAQYENVLFAIKDYTDPRLKGIL